MALQSDVGSWLSVIFASIFLGRATAFPGRRWFSFLIAFDWAPEYFYEVHTFHMACHWIFQIQIWTATCGSSTIGTAHCCILFAIRPSTPLTLPIHRGHEIRKNWFFALLRVSPFTSCCRKIKPTETMYSEFSFPVNIFIFQKVKCCVGRHYPPVDFIYFFAVFCESCTQVHIIVYIFS